MQIYCPSNTRALLKQSNVQISNFALRYRYFLPARLHQGKIRFGLQAQQPNSIPDLKNSEIEPLRDRQTEQVRYLASNGHFYCATSQVDWRMVVGLGGNHVQETNMTLDHIHGIPYLPGSAFKGVLRSWVIQEHFKNDEKLATQNKDYLNVFGSQESAGQVQFLDVFPNSGVHFDIDIMNPHFSQYYTGSDFPTDFQRLIQIYFLTLKGTHFRFLMIAKTAASLQLAKNWFTGAITDRGFGAKSAVGYGYFRGLDDKTNELKYKFAKKLSLDDAYNIYCNKPNQRYAIYIDLAPLVNYFPKFSVIITEDICEIEKIGGIDDIPELLIQADTGIVIPSKFGKWVYEKTKSKLFERELPVFPNLIYRSEFNRNRRGLLQDQSDQFKLLQEKLLQIAIDTRRIINDNLPQTDRDSLADRLMDIAEKLADGEVFTNLSSDERDVLAQKLLEIADKLLAVVVEETIPETIPVEGGRTIICGGLENGNLILRRYTNQ